MRTGFPRRRKDRWNRPQDSLKRRPRNGHADRPGSKEKQETPTAHRTEAIDPVLSSPVIIPILHDFGPLCAAGRFAPVERFLSMDTKDDTAKGPKNIRFPTEKPCGPVKKGRLAPLFHYITVIPEKRAALLVPF